MAAHSHTDSTQSQETTAQAPMTVRVVWNWRSDWYQTTRNKDMLLHMLDELVAHLKKWCEQHGNKSVLLEHRHRTMPTLTFLKASAYTHWLLTYASTELLDTVFDYQVYRE